MATPTFPCKNKFIIIKSTLPFKHVLYFLFTYYLKRRNLPIVYIRRIINRVCKFYYLLRIISIFIKSNDINVMLSFKDNFPKIVAI